MSRSPLLITILVSLGALGALLSSRESASSPADVLVIRDLDTIRFTNDSDRDLHNCLVRIDGFEAVLRELPTGGRGALTRADFDPALPRDEFYRRALRTNLQCYDDQNAVVPVRVK